MSLCLKGHVTVCVYIHVCDILYIRAECICVRVCECHLTVCTIIM